ncbi:hypothetical protein CRG98_034531 [Punica granatum]|uniref:Uncharacterized protein n=1 Tax=Punica granatum TaxID=22663 RepID=A0A2I0IM29_PUNGR|nr:hypothetical protein CRG98_034531 [Punica granatum]
MTPTPPPLPPPRVSASFVGAGALCGRVGVGVGVTDWRPRPRIDRGLRLRVPSQFGVEAANRRPRPLHHGHRSPLWVPAPSVEGSGSPIGGLDPLPLRFFFIGLK